MKTLIKVLVGFIFLMLMIFLGMKLTLPKIAMAKSSMGWNEIEGVVLMNSIDSHKIKNKKQFKLNFKYEYKINGSVYSGSSRYYDFKEPNQNFGKQKFKKFIQRYPVGNTIKVYYNPVNHNESTIKRGLLVQHWVLVFINFFFLLMSLHLIFYPKKWRLSLRA